MVAKARVLCLFAVVSVIHSVAGAQAVSLPVSLTRMELDLSVDYAAETIDGTARLKVRNHENGPVRKIPLQTHRLMGVTAVTGPSRIALPFTQDVVRFTDWPSMQVNQVYVELPRPLAPGDSVGIEVKWNGILTGYAETGMLYVRDRVDTAFTILRSETRAFPILAVPTDSINRSAPGSDFEFTVRITVPKDQVVALGGEFVGRRESVNTATWEYRSLKRAGWVNIAIAPYRRIEQNGLRVYYFPADSAGAFALMSAAQRALERLTLWFGPMGGKLDLPIIEIPDGFGSQASLAAGIIQSAAAFRGKESLGELYHELSHLWNAPDLDARSPRWNEGLASFLQDLLAEQLDGWKDRDARARRYAVRFLERYERDTTNLRTPFIGYGDAGRTDLSYGVGYFMFSALYETLGPETFNRVMGGYYQTHRLSGGTTRDFAGYAITNSPCNLEPFFDEWLYTVAWHGRLAKAKGLKDLATTCTVAAR